MTSSYPIPMNKIKTDEWEQFWNWMSKNTSQKSFAPDRTIGYHKHENDIDELTIQFYLNFKTLILRNPPKCTCAVNPQMHHNPYSGHNIGCDVEFFNQFLLKYYCVSQDGKSWVIDKLSERPNADVQKYYECVKRAQHLKQLKEFDPRF